MKKLNLKGFVAKITLVFIFVILLSGCAGMGKIVSKAARYTHGDVRTILKITGTSLSTAEQAISRQQALRKQQEAKRKAEQEQLRKQQEREQMLAAMNPEKRADFLQKEEEAKIAKANAVMGVFSALIRLGTSSDSSQPSQKSSSGADDEEYRRLVWGATNGCKTGNC